MSKFGVSILLVVVISTFVVMVSTGTLTQLIAKKKGEKTNVFIGIISLFLTVLVYLGAKKLYIRFPRVYTSPLLITPAVLVVLLASCQCPVSDIQSRRRTADRYASAGNSGVRHPAL